MLTIIGLNKSERCNTFRNKLILKGVDFDYVNFTDLREEEQDEIMVSAEESGNIYFPIVIKDYEIVSADSILED